MPASSSEDSSLTPENVCDSKPANPPATQPSSWLRVDREPDRKYEGRLEGAVA